MKNFFFKLCVFMVLSGVSGSTYSREDDSFGLEIISKNSKAPLRSGSLDIFPQEVITNIISHLDGEGCLAFRESCQRIHALVTAESERIFSNYDTNAPYVESSSYEALEQASKIRCTFKIENTHKKLVFLGRPRSIHINFLNKSSHPGDLNFFQVGPYFVKELPSLPINQSYFETEKIPIYRSGFPQNHLSFFETRPSDFFKDCVLKRVSLDLKVFTPTGQELMIYFLENKLHKGEYRGLATLSLENIEDERSFLKLSNILTRNTSISCLELKNCGIDDKRVALLAQALQKNPSIHTLDLSNNSIGDKGVLALIAFLREKKGQIISLMLHNNKVQDQGVLEIIKADLIHDLSLGNNLISDEGVLEMAHKRENTTRLTRLTCSLPGTLPTETLKTLFQKFPYHSKKALSLKPHQESEKKDETYFYLKNGPLVLITPGGESIKFEEGMSIEIPLKFSLSFSSLVELFCDESFLEKGDLKVDLNTIKNKKNHPIKALFPLAPVLAQIQKMPNLETLTLTLSKIDSTIAEEIMTALGNCTSLQTLCLTAPTSETFSFKEEQESLIRLFKSQTYKTSLEITAGLQQ